MYFVKSLRERVCVSGYLLFEEVEEKMQEMEKVSWGRELEEERRPASAK